MTTSQWTLLTALSALALTGSGAPACAEPAAGEGDLVLWYRQPAAEWTEALPVGSGRLGAMVFGGVREERLQLNEESVWAGPPVPEPLSGVSHVVDEARQAWFEGDYARCHEVEFQREVFSSAPDQVLVVRLSSDTAGQVSFDLALDRPADAAVRVEGERTLVMSGRAQHSGRQLGTRFETRVLVRAQGGRITARGPGAGLRIEGADAVTLLLVAATDYDPSRPLPLPDRDPGPRCSETLRGVAEKPYEQLLADVGGVVNHEPRSPVDLSRWTWRGTRGGFARSSSAPIWAGPSPCVWAGRRSAWTHDVEASTTWTPT